MDADNDRMWAMIWARRWVLACYDTPRHRFRRLKLELRAENYGLKALFEEEIERLKTLQTERKGRSLSGRWPAWLDASELVPPMPREGRGERPRPSELED